jgi:hypothetical protein
LFSLPAHFRPSNHTAPIASVELAELKLTVERWQHQDSIGNVCSSSAIISRSQIMIDPSLALLQKRGESNLLKVPLFKGDLGGLITSFLNKNHPFTID